MRNATRKHLTLILWLTVIIFFISSTTALAKWSFRQNSWDFSLTANWTEDENIKFRNGSEVNINGDQGFGFGFGYHLNEHLRLGMDFSWLSANYDLQTFDDTSAPVSINGHLDSSSTSFEVNYNILRRSFTPYVSGALGSTYIDTNIPSGPPSGACWWDPWYGYYVCSSYVPTYSDWFFSYRVGAGVRWDAGDAFYLKGGADQTWVDVNNTSGTPSFLKWQLQLGWLF